MLDNECYVVPNPARERSRTLLPMLLTLISSLAALAGGAGGSVAAADRVALRPAIVQRPIPFDARRKRETADYTQRHYGIRTFRLRPAVIVEHYTVTTNFQAAWNTFAPDRPDGELHELPGVCAHFVVDKDGTIYQLVRLRYICRHTVGLNDRAIGIEQVGMSAAEILARPRQRRAIVALTAWLRCRYRIERRNVIGHAMSLSSPLHHERVARLRTQTHGDWTARELAPIRHDLTRYRCPA